jgi:hypothetical protein
MRDRIKHGESRAGFGFQISIVVGSLRYCKVEGFSVVLIGNWDRNSMQFSGATEIQFGLAVSTEIQYGLATSTENQYSLA